MVLPSADAHSWGVLILRAYRVSYMGYLWPDEVARCFERVVMRNVLLVCLLVAVVVMGCSEGTRDRLNRFFFEVPEDAAAEATGAEPAAPDADVIPAEPKFASVHEPYESRACDRCHDVETRRVIEDASVACGGCHARFFSDEVEHEPVAGGECAMCHVGHRSAYPSLLRGAMPAACADCHDPDDLDEEEHDGDNVENCTACHDAHFGSAPYLKPEKS